jgi:serine/threonine protein kinase
MNAVHASQTSTREDQQLIELVEEITARLQAGRSCDIDEYAARFPEYADRLRDWMTVMSAMADLGHSLATGAASRVAQSSPASPRTDDTAGLSTRDEADGHVTGVLGDFRILRELGRGGMGVVYEAEQISIGRRVALKVLPFAAMLDKQQLNRFKNEARAAGTLDHPNIVAIHSVGTERGVHYYAMQLIEGQSLAQVVDQLRRENGRAVDQQRSSGVEQSAIRNPQSEIETQHAALPTLHAPTSSLPAFASREYFRTIAQLGIQAAEALDHAHQNGILHRDIKPANLLVDDSGKLWITDFGLARMEQDAGMTMTGDILGTLRYMSPEQALAKRVVVDHRSDIYSLGVTLYEMLTLQPAYAADDRQELLRQIAFEEPRKLRQLSARIPQDLETIVLKAIEKNPTDRYATAHDSAADLRRFVDDKTIYATPPSLQQRIGKWSRRNQRFVAAIGVVMTLLVVGSTLASVLIWREKQQTRAALMQTQLQRSLAEKSAAESKAVIKFFVEDLLGAVDPARAMGRKVTVEEVLREAARKIDTGIESHPLVEASIRRAIAKVHNSLGNHQMAEHHLRRALAIQAKLNRVDRDSLATESELANTLFFQEKYDDAGKLFVDVLEKQRRILGSDDIDTLGSMNDLGNVLICQGKHDAGGKLYEQALNSVQRKLGPEHPYTLVAKHNLAIFYGKKGRLADACRLYEQVIEVNARVLGPDHPNTLAAVTFLAEVLRTLGNYDRARKLHRETLESRRRIFGPDHGATHQSMNYLASLLDDMGNHEEAFDMYQSCAEDEYRGERWESAANMARNAREFAETPASVAKSSFYLAMACWRTGDREEARTIYAQAKDTMSEAPDGEELAQLRDEAAALLGITKESTTTKPE